MQVNKIAILIDGGFFVAMFRKLNKGVAPKRANVEELIINIMQEIRKRSGSDCIDILFRSYYYDCLPFSKTIKDLNGNLIKYAESDVYKNQMFYLNSLKSIDQFALRLGEIGFSGWKLNSYKPKIQKAIPDFRQKGVDMKIGLDMAWMAGKRTVDKLVLVTGDSDFISPMKHVRREGLQIYLHPMKTHFIKSELKEHADFILDI